MAKPKSKRLNRNLAWLLTLSLFLASCATPMSRGWEHFSKAEWDKARAEWSQSKEPDLTKKADAAEKMFALHEKAEAAEAKGQEESETKLRLAILAQDQWPKDEWTKGNKELVAILAKAQDKKTQMTAKLQAAYDAGIKCGKENFMADEHEKASECFKSAQAAEGAYKGIDLKTEDVSFMIAAVDQALEIQRQMEEERRAAEAAKARFEAEQKARIEAAMAAARSARQAEELKRLEEERERQRIEAEKKRRWMAFLSKGHPLKPLVATVGIPSVGTGKMTKKGEDKKWQGGAQFPILKKKGMRAEDLFALEIVVPRQLKANYLRNYSNSRGSMLQFPQISGDNKHYYTEGYKGGRFYTEVESVVDGPVDYKVQGVIYKIPVVH
ncbi:MAG: hypothetical protein RRB13_16460 [bacterium]|nr:hypothetical protein [bacterium]